MRLSLDHNSSVLQELRARGARADDFPEGFAAERIDQGHEALVAGRPLLFLRADRSAAVVDASRATELACVDATRLGASGERPVGRFLPRAIEELGHRELLLFLLRSGVVRTWAHIGSELTVGPERLVDGAYEADVSGSHVYFTSKRHEARLAFTVRIAADGAVAVRGRS